MDRLRQLELIALDLGPIGPDGIPTIDCIRRGLGPFDVEGTLLIAIRAAYTVDGVIDWDVDGGGRVQDRHQGVLILDTRYITTLGPWSTGDRW